ncbi:MAG: hypothetical protein ABIJ59_02160 [Pseudomonadota bacterium]
MGIFDKLFGGKKEYSPLDPNDPIFEQLNGIRQPLEDLANQTKDSLEVVTADKSTYVFIGNPPKQFGIAWVQDGKVYNLKTLAAKEGLSPIKLQKTSEKLSEAYKRSEKDARYSTQIGGCSLTVAASETLGKEVDHIIHTASA